MQSTLKTTPLINNFPFRIRKSSSHIYGDGSTAAGKEPQHTYPFAKDVVTRLISTNNGLCSDTMDIPLKIKSVFESVEITNGNVLTLNNDGINDCFKIEVEYEFENCIEVQIFDRWGRTVYKSDNKGCWDGSSQKTGEWVSAGTYYYTISINEYTKTVQYGGGCGKADFLLRKISEGEKEIEFELLCTKNDLCKALINKQYYFLLDNKKCKKISMWANKKKVL